MKEKKAVLLNIPSNLAYQIDLEARHLEMNRTEYILSAIVRGMSDIPQLSPGWVVKSKNWDPKRRYIT